MASGLCFPRCWLHHALQDLDDQLREIGSRLILRLVEPGDLSSELVGIARESGANAVYWNRCFEPHALRQDREAELALRDAGLDVQVCGSTLLFDPASIRNRGGKPFQVFTAFWNHCSSLPIAPPTKTDLRGLRSSNELPQSLGLEQLELLPASSWDSGIYAFWKSLKRKSQLNRIKRFAASKIANYPESRDIPDLDGTSRASPALHFGQIGIRELWQLAESRNDPAREHGLAYRRQLMWREFAQHLMVHFPHTTHEPLREAYALFPWEENERFLTAWQHGNTGFPIIDAGMRQLWQTGWMHNRVRMIVGSFLVKHLLQHWLEGARWFWDTLVDADLANNTLGWQWIAGCGADAAPYFRVFNPITQGSKFDPDGSYVKRYLPQLNQVPASHIHQPWTLGELDLASMGVHLGVNYPRPILTHAEGRARALKAFESLKARKAALC